MFQRSNVYLFALRYVFAKCNVTIQLIARLFLSLEIPKFMCQTDQQLSCPVLSGLCQSVREKAWQ